MQYAAEIHIVQAIAEGERPEWGCDAVWKSNPPDLSLFDADHCAAVTAVLVEVHPDAVSPPWLDNLLDQFPEGCGDSVELPGAQRPRPKILSGSWSAGCT